MERAGARTILAPVSHAKEQTEAEQNGVAEDEVRSGAPVEVGADQVERLLTDLNGPQREAVTFGEDRC
jgi:hypothetical protein